LVSNNTVMINIPTIHTSIDLFIQNLHSLFWYIVILSINTPKI